MASERAENWLNYARAFVLGMFVGGLWVYFLQRIFEDMK